MDVCYQSLLITIDVAYLFLSLGNLLQL
jgi:hypothetical protein